MPVKSDITQIATIAASGTTSNEITLNVGGYLEGISVPSGFTTSDVYMQGEYDPNGSNFRDMYDANGNRVTISSAQADRYIPLSSEVTRGLAKVKLVSAQTQISEVAIPVVIQFEA